MSSYRGNNRYRLITIDDYEQYVGAETIERIRVKARKIRDYYIAHVNSTYYGGGVAEMLSPLTLLMCSAGIKTEWRAIQGSPDFFSITKKMHNSLQGAKIHLTDRKMQIYEQVLYENAVRHRLDHDIVIIHDPQPLGLINFYHKKGPWVWRCHVDLTNVNDELWRYLAPSINKYDAAIFSIKEFKQKLKIPQLFFLPAIDPFSIKNREMSEREINERLKKYKIPVDLPLVVQISRFDKWKDPKGVIETFKIARKKVPATLVLLGDLALDDPEGEEVYHSILDLRDERIIIHSVQDTALVNALQRKATVVVQKSIREGFGLTVTEAMWKKKPVIGGNVGGIRHQIQNGVNGFLVSSVKEAAERMVELLTDERLRITIGEKAHQTVRERFLLIRLLEQYFDMFNSFEAHYHYTNPLMHVR
jgi:trehalose synthase